MPTSPPVANLHVTSDSPKTYLTTNSLLLTRSLTDNTNSRLTHSLYVCIYSIYCILVIKLEEKNIKKIVRKSTFTVLYIFTTKIPHK